MMETFIYLAGAVAIGVIAAAVALWVIARGPVERLLGEMEVRRGAGRNVPARDAVPDPTLYRPDASSRNSFHD